MKMIVAAILDTVACVGGNISTASSLSPDSWPAGDYGLFLQAQAWFDLKRDKPKAVTVAYNGLAARAGFEAVKRGGNAIDAAMTTAITQIALTAGALVSYFGIMSLVYYDAATRKTYTMNAEWNTVLRETDPLTVPGMIDYSPAGMWGSVPSGSRPTIVITVRLLPIERIKCPDSVTDAFILCRGAVKERNFSYVSGIAPSARR
jgi:hypothetical protein